MVVIRLSRSGSKGRPFFNVVVADKRVRRDGSFIERIGFYNPTATEKEEGLRIAQDRLTYWKSVGAQPSPTVERLVKQHAKIAAAYFLSAVFLRKARCLTHRALFFYTIVPCSVQRSTFNPSKSAPCL